MEKQRAVAYIDEIAERICRLSDEIWACPELAFREYHSAALQKEALRELGFTVTEDLAGIATAFSGSYGSGKPVIAILGEFDALADLSQKAGAGKRSPVKKGGCGHGCGHNALGAGAIAAAAAVKQYLAETKRPGTVVYFGCPGEEGGSGKAFMARDGVFADADCAVTWHPASQNIISKCMNSANVQVKYRFYGKAAHAASAWNGRSALDAMELMNTGVQYLREHMPSTCCLHYAVTDGGGLSPNVVQPYAEVLYLIRGQSSVEAAALKQRVDKIAKGAAMMTETSVRVEFIKACSDYLPNETLNRVMQKNAEAIPFPKHTDEERAYAAQLAKTFGGSGKGLKSYMEKRLTPEQAEPLRKHIGEPLYDFVLPLAQMSFRTKGSTDVGDVSHCCPTVSMNACCYAADTPAHSWQLTAQGKSGPMHKGLVWAAKVMAATAIDLLCEPEMLAEAQREFDKATGGKPYACPIPPNVKPKPMGR